MYHISLPHETSINTLRTNLGFFRKFTLDLLFELANYYIIQVIVYTHPWKTRSLGLNSRQKQTFKIAFEHSIDEYYTM